MLTVLSSHFRRLCHIEDSCSVEKWTYITFHSKSKVYPFHISDTAESVCCEGLEVTERIWASKSEGGVGHFPVKITKSKRSDILKETSDFISTWINLSGPLDISESGMIRSNANLVHQVTMLGFVTSVSTCRSVAGLSTLGQVYYPSANALKSSDTRHQGLEKPGGFARDAPFGMECSFAINIQELA
jgi:hypothetical protein